MSLCQCAAAGSYYGRHASWCPLHGAKPTVAPSDAAVITAAHRYRYLRDVAYYDTEVLCVVNHADYGDGRIPKGGMQFLNGKPLDDHVDEGIRLARARGRFE